jgi:predicted transcriptional regulator
MVDNVSAALDYVIGAIMFGNFKPSAEQIQRLKGVLPELTSTTSKEEKYKQLYTKLRTLRLDGITVNARQESINRITKAIADVKKLEADSEAVDLLSTSFGSAREKMEELLRRLNSGETFATAGSVRSINSYTQKLFLSLRR